MVNYYRSLGVIVEVNNYFKTYDNVIYYRSLDNKSKYKLKFLKKISKKIYWDTCVNYFDKCELVTDIQVDNSRWIAKYCDGVISSTHYIAEKAELYNKNVYVFEDPVDLGHFVQTKNNINFDNPTFCWSGVSHKADHLSKYKDIITDKMLLITDNKIHNMNLPFNYRFIQWEHNLFPLSLMEADIAFLPRRYEDTYNLGHSSFKALVFAVLGIPIIANKLPSYEVLSRFYEGIVFLEDYNDNIQSCINALKDRSLDTTKTKDHYSCQSQAEGLINFIIKKNTVCGI